MKAKRKLLRGRRLSALAALALLAMLGNASLGIDPRAARARQAADWIAVALVLLGPPRPQAAPEPA